MKGLSMMRLGAQFLKRVWGFLHNFVPMDLEIEMEKKKSAEFQEIEEEQIEKDTSKKIQDKYIIVDWKDSYTLSENFMIIPKSSEEMEDSRNTRF
ncbi:hypothetical protein Tco_0620045 [Tanacetum coccineum]